MLDSSLNLMMHNLQTNWWLAPSAPHGYINLARGSQSGQVYCGQVELRQVCKAGDYSRAEMTTAGTLSRVLLTWVRYAEGKIQTCRAEGTQKQDWEVLTLAEVYWRSVSAPTAGPGADVSQDNPRGLMNLCTLYYSYSSKCVVYYKSVSNSVL